MRSGGVIADRFEAAAEAGAGGMSVVYRARDRTPGQPVALKVLQGAELGARFQRESRVLAELSTLNGLYDSSCEEPLARAVLVTAPAGVGKSRLRYELVRQLEARDEPPEIRSGRGDPMSAGAPFAIIADAIRRATGLSDGDSPAAWASSPARPSPTRSACRCAPLAAIRW